MKMLFSKLSLLAVVFVLLTGCVSDNAGGSSDASRDVSADTSFDTRDAGDTTDSADTEEGYEFVQSCGYDLRNMASDEVVRRVEYTLDDSRNIVREEVMPVASGSRTEYVKTYTYDELERLTETVKDQVAPEDLVEVQATTYDGDSARKVLSEVTVGPSESDQTLETSVKYFYDESDELETIERYEPSGRLRSRTTITWNASRTTRTAVRRDPDGEFVSSVESQFDEDGRLRSRTITFLSGEERVEQRQEPVYDEQDRVTTTEVFEGDLLIFRYEFDYSCY